MFFEADPHGMKKTATLLSLIKGIKSIHVNLNFQQPVPRRTTPTVRKMIDASS